MSRLFKDREIISTHYAICLVEANSFEHNDYRIEIIKDKLYKVYKTDRTGMLFVENEFTYFGFYEWKFKILDNQKVAKLLYEQNNRLQD